MTDTWHKCHHSPLMWSLQISPMEPFCCTVATEFFLEGSRDGLYQSIGQAPDETGWKLRLCPHRMLCNSGNLLIDCAILVLLTLEMVKVFSKEAQLWVIIKSKVKKCLKCVSSSCSPTAVLRLLGLFASGSGLFQRRIPRLPSLSTCGNFHFFYVYYDS